VIELFEEGVYSTEDEVGGLVFASEVPPSLDDSFVITVYLKTSARASKPGDCTDEKFETDGLGPTDVTGTVQVLPTGDESPGSPSVFDGDGNPEARACI
jgi:hypothetical protein